MTLTRESGSGEYALEAGALVLGDQGKLSKTFSEKPKVFGKTLHSACIFYALFFNMYMFPDDSYMMCSQFSVSLVETFVWKNWIFKT